MAVAINFAALADKLHETPEILVEQEDRAAVQSIFADSRCYWQRNCKEWRSVYEPDRETYVLRNPLLTRYDSLCRMYEAENGITKVENPFARNLDYVIQNSLKIDDLGYESGFLPLNCLSLWQGNEGQRFVLWHPKLYANVALYETPTPETVMYHYPFSNVSAGNGSLCVGANTMPTYKKLHKAVNLPAFLLSIPNNMHSYDVVTDTAEQAA